MKALETLTNAGLRRILLTFTLLAAVAGIIFAAGGSRALAQDEPTDQQPTRTLRVATKPLEPFVYLDGEVPRGYSVEIWDEVAARLGVDFEWQTYDTVAQILDAVRNGQADVAISGISMTREREQTLDFSHAYFDAGLQILVPATTDRSFFDYVRTLFSPAFLVILGLFVLTAFILGNVIWLIERKADDFPDNYLAGVWEGIWWSMIVVATGEYPRKPTPQTLQRVLTISYWFAGLMLVAQFTASIASTLTVEKLNTSVQGPEDLPGKRIATVEGTTAAAYLQDQSIQYFPVNRIEEALEQLRNNEIDAVVYDAPVLQYYAATAGQGRVSLTGPVFKPEKYGIALPQGSDLREPINEILLAMYQDGTIEAIYGEYFRE